MKRSTYGFSLIELMVVVAIVTILAAIAIPSYNGSIRKSRRTEAKTAIMDLAAREERYLATQNVYSNDPGALQYAASGSAWPISVGNYYSITAVTVTNATSSAPATFALTVAPSTGSPQIKDTYCQKFMLDQTGKQTSQDNGGADSSTTCWP